MPRRDDKARPEVVRFTPTRDYTAGAIGTIGFTVELDAPVYLKQGVEYEARIFGAPGGERASLTRVDGLSIDY